MEIRICVATHKEYPMPSDPVYLPIQAGAAIHGRLPYTGDDTGENISERNRSFCELTVLYWAWKNLNADYIGLAHYRRHFAGRQFGEKWSRILSAGDAEKLLARAPIVLPRKRNYLIETNYSQYIHAHHARDLELTREILSERCPTYLSAFDRSMQRRSGHRFNMFLMRRDLLDRYCTWLFDILFELERRLDMSDYSDYDKRVFGFVAERLLDVWVESDDLRYTECPMIHMESQHWLKKGTAFLKRKFIHGN